MKFSSQTKSALLWNSSAILQIIQKYWINLKIFIFLHAEKRSVKFTGSSVLIWTTWLFSKFYQKLSSTNRFSVRFTQRPVKSTEYEKIRVKLIVLYAKWIVQKICWLNSTLIKFTKKSCCPNKYRTSCKFYWSFFCVWFILDFLQIYNKIL